MCIQLVMKDQEILLSSVSHSKAKMLTTSVVKLLEAERKKESVLPNVIDPAVHAYGHEHVEVNPYRKPMLSSLVAHPVNQCWLV